MRREEQLVRHYGPYSNVAQGKRQQKGIYDAICRRLLEKAVEPPDQEIQ
jgi:hypothetical protein